MIGMESILRAGFMYFFLMFIVRMSGARTLAEMTTFDFVLLLIIGDASQQAITSNDYSVTNAVIVITTFIVLDLIFTFIKSKYKKVERILDGSPIILINQGKVVKKMLKLTKIDECDILEAARKNQGLETLEQIKYAILEKGGDITVIPLQDR
jgi:uncharacterized membrane protein YcaP (DUF421 family)